MKITCSSKLCISSSAVASAVKRRSARLAAQSQGSLGSNSRCASSSRLIISEQLPSAHFIASQDHHHRIVDPYLHPPHSKLSESSSLRSLRNSHCLRSSSIESAVAAMEVDQSSDSTPDSAKTTTKGHASNSSSANASGHYSREQLKRDAPKHRGLFTFVVLCIYSLLDGADLVGRTYVAWLECPIGAAPEVCRIAPSKDFVELFLKSIAAYIFWGMLASLVAGVLW